MASKLEDSGIDMPLSYIGGDSLQIDLGIEAGVTAGVIVEGEVVILNTSNCRFSK